MIQIANKKRFDRLLGVGTGLTALLGVGVLFWILFDLIRLGASLLSWDFFTAEVENSGRAGGIGPIIQSTLLILFVCLAVAIPFGVGAALWITEVVSRASKWGKWLTASIDLLASLPSIVFGLFGVVFFCQLMDMGYSILAGGMTLACMILPILIRTTLTAMEALPLGLRASAHALGLSKTTVLVKVLLPQAIPGMIVGTTIGIARALSETAALIFTSGEATRSPESLLDSGRAISVHIFHLSENINNGERYAAASALVLLVALLLINLGVNFLSEKWLKSVT